MQVACGVSHTLFLVDADEKQLEPFEVFEPETTIEDEPKPAVKHGALTTSLCEVQTARVNDKYARLTLPVRTCMSAETE